MYEYSENEFIKLNRKILDWRWFSDPVTRDLFIYCLLKANWKCGEWHGVKYERGQFITSLHSLSSDLGFSMQNIRTALSHLKSTGELTYKATNKFRIITVVNYDKYQSANKQDNKQLTSNQQTTNNQLTTDIRSKEDKNIKEINKYIDDSEEPETPPESKGRVKHKHGEYNNVLLTDEELEKLKAEFPDYQERIERLSGYIASTGKKYASHYATIRAWARKEKPNADTTTKTEPERYGGIYL